MKLRRTIAGIVAATALSVGLVAPATADTGLIQVVTTDKIKAAKKVSFVLACSASCTVSAQLTLKLKHGTVGPNTVTGPGPLVAGQQVAPFIVLNGPGTQDLKRKPKAAKLNATITATDVTTGATDVVNRTFKFKK